MSVETGPYRATGPIRRFRYDPRIETGRVDPKSFGVYRIYNPKKITNRPSGEKRSRDTTKRNGGTTNLFDTIRNINSGNNNGVIVFMDYD